MDSARFSTLYIFPMKDLDMKQGIWGNGKIKKSGAEKCGMWVVFVSDLVFRIWLRLCLVGEAE